MRTTLGVCLSLAALLVVACGASGVGGREIRITQTAEGCTPTSVEATAGEKLNLLVTNETGDIYEIEGIEGTKLEEVIVPEGRTRSIGYQVPETGGVSKVKCYVPGGPATIIEIQAGGTAAPTTPAGGAGEATTDPSAGQSVTVTLVEYAVQPDKPSATAGKIQFIANNEGQGVHELYVLKARDGGYDVVGEIENVGPGGSGAITIDLQPGDYVLACLIVPGEAGSTVDHFQKGMHTEFKVE